MTLLEELAKVARERAAVLPEAGPLTRPRRPDFLEAIGGRERISVIAEFKRRSPSADAIAPAASVAQVVSAFRDAGAAAISVLTEPTRFGGSYEDLAIATETVDLPILMKDFVVTPAQVWHAARIGASAVLLIARLLAQSELEHLADEAREVGLTPLIECHDAKELVRASTIEDAVIGINNRDLETLEIDRRVVQELAKHVPEGKVVVAESGYDDPAQLAAVRGRVDAVLVGTALMRAGDPAAFVREVSA